MNLKVIEAKKFKSRLFGLMFKKKKTLPLLIPNCNRIHTYFMFKEIDVYYLDSTCKVLKIDKKMRPNKISEKVVNCMHILETDINELVTISIGDVMNFIKAK